MQAIANTAGFHFAYIEQGGSSLYSIMALKATSLEVLRIIVSIGGVETNHFSLWHDKAGNAVAQPLAGVTDPETGVTFPDLNAKGGELNQTNLILPEPCDFLHKDLPQCSIVRPTLDDNGGRGGHDQELHRRPAVRGPVPEVLQHRPRAGQRGRRRPAQPPLIAAQPARAPPNYPAANPTPGPAAAHPQSRGPVRPSERTPPCSPESSNPPT